MPVLLHGLRPFLYKPAPLRAQVIPALTDKEVVIDTENVQKNVERFIDQIAWYNVLDKIDIATRHGTFDGREVIIIESSEAMTPQGLIAYTMVHELDRYNDFDEKRVKNLARNMDIQRIQLADFIKDLKLVARGLSSSESFPVKKIEQVWRLFDQDILVSSKNY